MPRPAPNALPRRAAGRGALSLLTALLRWLAARIDARRQRRALDWVRDQPHLARDIGLPPAPPKPAARPEDLR